MRFDLDEQIRSGTHSKPTQRITLAGRSRKGKVQTNLRGFQVPPWNCTAITLRTVNLSRINRGMTAICALLPEVNSSFHEQNSRLTASETSHTFNRLHATLPDWLNDTSLSLCTFKISLKTFLFSEYGTPKHRSSIKIIYDIGL